MKKYKKKGNYILIFVFSIFILGIAIAKKFYLSPIEWVALLFWFGVIGIYKYSKSKEK